MTPTTRLLALAALGATLAACAVRGGGAPQPAGKGGAVKATATGLQIAPGTPASYVRWLNEQYGALPPHLRIPLRVRVASDAEINRYANPGVPGGKAAAVAAYPNDAEKREILLGKIESQARLAFLHEAAHCWFYTHLYPTKKHLDWYAWWDKGGGRPVALYWREQRDRNGLHGDPYEGFAHATLWTFFPQPSVNTYFSGKPCPPAVAAKVRSLLAP